MRGCSRRMNIPRIDGGFPLMAKKTFANSPAMNFISAADTKPAAGVKPPDRAVGTNSDSDRPDGDLSLDEFCQTDHRRRGGNVRGSRSLIGRLDQIKSPPETVSPRATVAPPATVTPPATITPPATVTPEAKTPFSAVGRGYTGSFCPRGAKQRGRPVGLPQGKLYGANVLQARYGEDGRPIKKTKSQRVQLLLTPELHEKLKAKAELAGKSVNAFINAALERAVRSSIAPDKY